MLSAAESLAAPLWVVATTALLVLLVGGVLELQRRARHWPRVRLPQRQPEGKRRLAFGGHDAMVPDRWSR